MIDDEFDAEETVEYMSIFRNTWSDGSRIQDPISKIETAGAGAFGEFSGAAWNCRAWGHLDFTTRGSAQDEDSGVVFSSIPVHLPTVQQRTELWGVIQFLQAFVLVFIGVDNLNVFNFVSKLLDGSEWFRPVSLHKD